MLNCCEPQSRLLLRASWRQTVTWFVLIRPYCGGVSLSIVTGPFAKLDCSAHERMMFVGFSNDIVCGGWFF